MEQTIHSCEWSACDSTFIKKRQGHRFCCDSHRKKWNRVNKGISELPKFFKTNKKALNGINQRFTTPSRVNYDYGKPERIKATGSNLKILLPVITFGISRIKGDDDISTILLTGAAFLIGKNLDKKNVDREVIIYPILNNKPKKGRKKKNTNKSRIMSGIEYSNAYIDSIGFKGKYNYLVGDPGHGFYMLVTGMPGNGKSTFAIKFGQYFKENHGKVLFLAGEQSGLNKPLQNLLQINNVTFDIDTKPSKEVNEIVKTAKGYSMLILDSVNHLNLSPYDIREIKKALPKLSIVGIMQSTKEGNFKGSQEYLHDCDIRVNCIDMIAHQTKSRYSPKSEAPILK